MSRSLILTICTLLLLTPSIHAQKQKFIIIRHAEKDTTVKGSQMMQADPPLSAKGQVRAESLIDLFQKYKINTIYSTNYNRTKSTVLPFADANGLSINEYDPKQLKAFAETLKAPANHSKTILIVGHSNTSPKLVNLLLGKDVYKDLDDAVYNQYWLVETNGRRTEAKVIEY
jgi:2,3-bisphosphoglycerate-dependent phosphoglycerate mutase